MRRYRNKKTVYAILLIVVFISLFFALPNPLFKARTKIAPKTDYIFYAIGNFGQTACASMKQILTLGRETEALKEENKALKAEIQELTSYRYENIELKELLGFKNREAQQMLPAQVTGRDISNWFYRFELDKGRADGVAKNMIVTTTDGVVGAITDVSEHTALVRTILNQRSMVPVYVVESGAFAMLSGENGTDTVLRYIYNASLLQEGQLVVTSGLGKIFPGGLIVGRTYKKTPNSNQFNVEPFANISGIKTVLIIRDRNEVKR